MAPEVGIGNVRVRVFRFQLDGYGWSCQRMDRLATVWLGLAVASPFLAAWFLGLGRKEQFNQREITGTFPVTYSRDSRP